VQGPLAINFFVQRVEEQSYSELLPFSVTNEARGLGQGKSFLPLLTRVSRRSAGCIPTYINTSYYDVIVHYSENGVEVTS
jgi:hypothetical protein